MKSLSEFALAIQPSSTMAIDAMFKQMKAEGQDVIGFGAGEPDFPTPGHIKEAGIQAIRNNDTRYTPSVGTVELRKAICQRLKADCGLDYDFKGIAVSNGAKTCVYVALRALVNPGDEVILPAPYWVSYIELIRMVGGVPVVIDTTEAEHFKITAEKLAAAITPKTKCMILNNPCNPTGMGYDRSTLELLGRVAEEHDLLIAADEIYTTYLYEGDFIPLRTIPGLAHRVITLNSFSKNFLMTGWRVGVAIAEPEILEVMSNINNSLIYTAPSISQRAAIQALAIRQTIREKYVLAYRDRIFYAADRMEQIPYLSLVRPKGTFYLFPGIEKTGLSAEDFCQALLERAHVLVTPGTLFGSTGAGHFRIACTVGLDRLKEAFDRMEGLSF